MKQTQTLTLAQSALWRGRTPPRSERGVVVFIALIVLVAMTLAGLATLRASGSAILTAGNLGFRQGATVSGDVGGESGLAWVKTQGPVTLQARDTSKGYYANWTDLQPPPPASLPTCPAPVANQPLPSNWAQCWGEANWENAANAVQVNGGALDAAGNRVSYVIHRMCAENGIITGAGVSPSQECVTLSDPGKGSPKEAGQKALTGTSQVYYRITARIEGPKNTVSYVQTMVY
jgi:type IV pilus assembly protein PilX